MNRLAGLTKDLLEPSVGLLSILVAVLAILFSTLDQQESDDGFGRDDFNWFTYQTYATRASLLLVAMAVLLIVAHEAIPEVINQLLGPPPHDKQILNRISHLVIFYFLSSLIIAVATSSYTSRKLIKLLIIKIARPTRNTQAGDISASPVKDEDLLQPTRPDS